MSGVARPRRSRHDQESAGALGPTAARRRRELGLTQRDLALLAEVSERSIQALEAGKLTMRADTLTKVLDALGLALAVLPKSHARHLAETASIVILSGVLRPRLAENSTGRS